MNVRASVEAKHEHECVNAVFCIDLDFFGKLTNGSDQNWLRNYYFQKFIEFVTLFEEKL